MASRLRSRVAQVETSGMVLKHSWARVQLVKEAESNGHGEGAPPVWKLSELVLEQVWPVIPGFPDPDAMI